MEEFLDVLERQMDAMGEFHQSTLRTRHELASTLLELGRPEDAEKEFREVLSQSRAALGNEHQVTVAALHALERLNQRKETSHSLRIRGHVAFIKRVWCQRFSARLPVGTSRD